MATAKTDILVYAHWKGMAHPMKIGILSAQQAKGRKAISFTYHDDWLQSKEQQLLDPGIDWYSGPQYPGGKENFGMIMDSMPDTWGRTLMKRREGIQAREESRQPKTLYEIDFLLGVNDETRMGALRFKLNEEGDFLDNDLQMPTPPWTSLRELQHAAKMVESDQDNEEVKKYKEFINVEKLIVSLLVLGVFTGCTTNGLYSVSKTIYIKGKEVVVENYDSLDDDTKRKLEAIDELAIKYDETRLEVHK